jgi:O-antigen/teichoic acid export membrane protein
VGLALLISNVLGYLLLARIGRWLPANEFAVFLSTWGVIFGLGSALSIVEQEVSRQSAAAATKGERTGQSAVRVTVLAGLLICTFSIGLALSPLRGGLYDGKWLIAVLTCIATVGFGPQFFVRGLLLGHTRIRSYSAILVVEPAVRVLAATFIAVAMTEHHLVLLVLAVTSGSFAWVGFLFAARGLVDTTTRAEPWLVLIWRVVSLCSAAGLSACLITGYPAVVTAVVGDTAGLATLFTIITASRVPLVIAAPVLALAVPVVVRVVAAGGTRQIHEYLKRGGVALVAAASICGVGGALLGPLAIRLLFGSQYPAEPLMVSLVLSSSVFIAGVVLTTSALLALQRYGTVVLTWGAAVLVALMVLSIWPGGAAERGSTALIFASAAGCVTGGLTLSRATRKL